MQRKQVAKESSRVHADDFPLKRPTIFNELTRFEKAEQED